MVAGIRDGEVVVASNSVTSAENPWCFQEAIACFYIWCGREDSTKSESLDEGYKKNPRRRREHGGRGRSRTRRLNINSSYDESVTRGDSSKFSSGRDRTISEVEPIFLAGEKPVIQPSRSFSPLYVQGKPLERASVREVQDQDIKVQSQGFKNSGTKKASWRSRIKHSLSKKDGQQEKCLPGPMNAGEHHENYRDPTQQGKRVKKAVTRGKPGPSSGEGVSKDMGKSSSGLDGSPNSGKTRRTHLARRRIRSKGKKDLTRDNGNCFRKNRIVKKRSTVEPIEDDHIRYI